jgi:hypothetical protein
MGNQKSEQIVPMILFAVPFERDRIRLGKVICSENFQAREA